MNREEDLARRGMRWTWLAVVVVSVGAASLVVSAQANQLRLVSTAWSPFTNAPGKPRFALDLVEAALGRIDMGVSTTIVDAADFTRSLLYGEYDGSAAAWKDADRERLLLFSQPYLENRLILVARKGADVSAKTLAALKGKRVVIVGGYSYGDIESGGPTFVKSLGEEDSLTLLLGARADYALMDELVVQYLTEHYAAEAQSKLEIGSTPLVSRQLYLAIRRSRPDAESIINRFNAQLRTMMSDHTYHHLLHVDWIRADVDGDGVAEYVPSSDRMGPTAPQHAYSILSQNAQTSAQSRFLIGGNIYTTWASVPESYKDPGAQPPDPARSTASIFTFTW